MQSNMKSDKVPKRTTVDHAVRFLGGFCLVAILSANECIEQIVPTDASDYISHFEWDEAKGQYIRGSCFTGETLVTLADGTQLAISEIRIGDQVLGRNGALNRVTGIEAPPLGHRYLYGFNGTDAFVTAEHPFWTAEGWQAIDPQAAEVEGFLATVDALTVGDQVAVLQVDDPQDMIVPAALSSDDPDGRGVSYRAIESIQVAFENPNTEVFNLLLDGDHTYFANGYLVHNKEGERK